MSLSPARVLALDVVTRVRTRSAYAHETLGALMSETDLDPRDAAFATRLAYGTVACRGTLDEAVARYVSQPAGLEPEVADALAVSAYEILFARTPGRAAVSQGVELVRSVRPRAAGFANAVLRRLSEAAESFPWADPESDLAALARLHGHPLWLAELWTNELGRDRAAAVMAANNEPAPLYLAHLPFSSEESDVVAALESEGTDPRVGPVTGCIEAGRPAAAVRSAELAESRVVVVDAAAQFAAACVNPRPGSTAVDVGAGRGTKSVLISASAWRAGGTCDVVAVDSHQFKLDVARALADRTGAPGITTCVADATAPSPAACYPLPGTADAVLVDAPCSGLGTLRRHPDRRWRAAPDEIETLSVLGETLLRSAALLVKPGGCVVYSTCTIARRENAEVIEGFLRSSDGAGFEVDPLGPEVPAVWTDFVTDEGYFQSLPEIGGCDGHFVARLVRRQ